MNEGNYLKMFEGRFVAEIQLKRSYELTLLRCNLQSCLSAGVQTSPLEINTHDSNTQQYRKSEPRPGNRWYLPHPSFNADGHLSIVKADTHKLHTMALLLFTTIFRCSCRFVPPAAIQYTRCTKRPIQKVLEDGGSLTALLDFFATPSPYG